MQLPIFSSAHLLWRSLDWPKTVHVHGWTVGNTPRDIVTKPVAWSWVETVKSISWRCNAIRTSLQRRVTSTPACTHLKPPKPHPLGNTATLALARSGSPQLRRSCLIGIEPLSSRQVPNGSCRLAHGYSCGKRRGGRGGRTHITSSPTAHGARYIGPYGDSFIFHFFSPDLAGVPDLGLLTLSRTRERIASGQWTR